MRLIFCAISALLVFCNQAAAFDVEVASKSSTLFYNSAPAVRTPSGEYAIGVIGEGGDVKVITLNASGDYVSSAVIHRYGAEDDHGAPALWAGEHALYVATALHSSDLFVYRVPYLTGEAPALICHLSGLYTYPRFFDRGGLKLLIRRDALEDTKIANYRGMLSQVSIGPADSCGDPIDLINPGFRHWVYATPPTAIGAETVVAWSVYDEVANVHSGVFVGTITNGGVRDQRSLVDIPDTGELVAWDVGYWDGAPAVSYVEFSGGYECCNSGEQVEHVVTLDGTPAYRSEERAIPYYPDGISLSRQANGSNTPCTPVGASMRLPVADFGWVYMKLGSEHRSKAFDSSVWMCLR